MARAQRLNIHLMKAGTALDEVLREDVGPVKGHAIKPDMPFQGRIWVKKSLARPITWQDFVQSGTGDSLGDLLAQGPSAVVALWASDRLFCLVFGAARHWLASEKIERRFGMLVTLNTVHDEGLRSVDREEFEAVTLVTRSQTSVSSSIEKFGLDVQRDLVRSVTGSPIDPNFATQITGADNLVLSVKLGFSELGAKCSEALMHYQEERYRKTYAWIDNFQRVTDREEIRNLEGQLVASLRDEANQNVFLSPPDITDGQRAVEYRYPGERKGNPTYPDLRLADLLKKFTRQEITIDFIKKKKVREIDTETETTVREYSIYDALVFEALRAEKLYALSRGEWYTIAQSYVNQVREELATVKANPALQLPDALTGEREGAYNRRAAGSREALFLLDQKLVDYGPGRSSIEVCDLLGVDGNFIHVKAKTKSSALSHLFAQGLVSGQVLRDKRFRELASEKCEAETHRHIFTTDPFDPSTHSVTYAVLTSAPGDLRDALPFFSQQSLVNAAKELRNMGYQVWLNKVAIAEAA